MPAQRVIIDCDPGHDDAINLLVALSSPDDLDILGITAVAGNAPLDMTERNARMIRDIAGRSDIPVFRGCRRPLKREPVTAQAAHGATGLDALPFVEPTAGCGDEHAVDFIVDTLLAAADGSVTLVTTGPLTNVASAMRKNTRILSKVAEIVMMGGAMREAGNCTPSAEYNIFADPHAADVVFRSGCAITAFGLDVTHQVLATEEFSDRMHGLGNAAGRAAGTSVEFMSRYDGYRNRFTGVPLHDPCTVAFLLRRDLFQGRRCNLTVETASELTMGHTAVDFWHATDRAPNVYWIHRVDVAGMLDLLVERLRRLGGR
jgi:purine nucleosidase